MSKKKPDEGKDESALVSAAKAVGSAAGKVASLVGATVKRERTAPKGRLAPKHKQRLPRRLKKANKKLALAHPTL
jgi:hypothetical protein